MSEPEVLRKLAEASRTLPARLRGQAINQSILPEHLLMYEAANQIEALLQLIDLYVAAPSPNGVPNDRQSRG